MASPRVQGKWPRPFPATRLASWCQHALRLPPTGVSCLCSAESSSISRGLPGGWEEVLSSARRWGSPWDQAERRGPRLPSTSGFEAGGWRPQEAKEDSGSGAASGEQHGGLWSSWNHPASLCWSFQRRCPHPPAFAFILPSFLLSLLRPWCTISPVSLFLSVLIPPSLLFFSLQIFMEHLLCTRSYSRH